MLDEHLSTMWDGILPSIRSTAQKHFLIPSDIRSIILPNPNISLNLLSNFTLPIASPNVDANSTCQFFSQEDPVCMTAPEISKLRYLPIPDKSTTHRLINESRKAWINGTHSLIYPHLAGDKPVTTAFPLWVITFWSKATDSRKLIKQWAAAKDWVLDQVCQKKSVEVRHLAEQASNMLNVLPYGIPRPGGLSDKAPIHELWCYLGPNWLEGSQLNDHLHLLCREVPNLLNVASYPSNHSIHIEGTTLIPKILEAYAKKEGGQYLS
jgi:hypothetical protein